MKRGLNRLTLAKVTVAIMLVSEFACTVDVDTGSGSGLTLSPTPTMPPAPTDLQVTAKTISSISLSWSSPAGSVTGYRIYEGSVVQVTLTDTSASFGGLGTCSKHTYAVTAYNAAGESARSGTISVTTDGCPTPTVTYNSVILADNPIAFWDMNGANGTEVDLTGNGNTGTYKGGTPSKIAMPNGDLAVDFNGASQYLYIPSNASMSLPTTGNLTWEAWIRPDTLQFSNQRSSGYVDWMGKCQEYSPTCEWEARMYNTRNKERRPNRISAYVFNPGAGLGSAADWQPVNSLIKVNHWYHIVGEYTVLSQPSNCSFSYPGSINIWVNGVMWNHSYHGDTGCMSQYKVKPVANDSPLTIGTMAMDTWFQGAVGKVAIYNYLLTKEQIGNHYQTMTGRTPSGSCADTCTLTNP